MLGAICKITKPGHVVAAELCGRSHNTVFEQFPALNPFAPAQWHWTRQIPWFARKITLKVTSKVTLSFWRMNYSQPICLYYIVKTHGWGVWCHVITYSAENTPNALKNLYMAKGWRIQNWISIHLINNLHIAEDWFQLVSMREGESVMPRDKLHSAKHLLRPFTLSHYHFQRFQL